MRTYSAPSDRIKATDTLVRGFILRSHTRKIGRIPIVQSEIAETAAWAYVESRIILGLTHLPVAPRYCVQK